MINVFSVFSVLWQKQYQEIRSLANLKLKIIQIICASLNNSQKQSLTGLEFVFENILMHISKISIQCAYSATPSKL